MASKATLEEHNFVCQADYETPRYGATELNAPCPRCGKKLIRKELTHGAYIVHCEDEHCIEVIFRGL